MVSTLPCKVGNASSILPAVEWEVHLGLLLTEESAYHQATGYLGVGLSQSLLLKLFIPPKHLALAIGSRQG